MPNASFRVPAAVNEPVKDYAPGSRERSALQARLKKLSAEQVEIPLIIGGKEIRTGNTATNACPHRHSQVLASYHKGDAESVAQAARACAEAARDWAETPWEQRVAIFLKAAELLAGPWRQVLNAATMLGQSKSALQAEIDSACELIDFWRFNVEFMQELYLEQPRSGPGCWNRIEQRPLEGFVFAVTPFNFTAIAGNLPSAPALMGNTVIWKPASSSVYSGYQLMKLYQEAGLPPGVINFVPGSGSEIGAPAIAHPDFAGVHFTGSTSVFQGMWRQIGENINSYKSYPRIVGETGGKDFILAHASADLPALCTAMVRGAYEYQGQKCSAASRAYIPASIWPALRTQLLDTIRTIKMGPPENFENFVNAVIDRNAFDSILGYLAQAKACPDSEILIGGESDDSEGFFVQPTLIQAKRPDTKTMVEEIFGPVLTIFVYEDARLDETLESCDTASAYALTGSVFARDRKAISHISDRLRHAAGNFYINDKPSGAVVGQQPFGGSRASGTNDKAGSKMNLQRWVSTRTIKETFLPPTDYTYPFMGEE